MSEDVRRLLLMCAPLLCLMLGASSPSIGPVSLHIVDDGTVSIGYAMLAEGELVFLGPMSEFPAEEIINPGSDAGGPSQEIETVWVSGGVQRRIVTKLGSGTNAIELAITRHQKLEARVMLQWPRDP